MSTERRVQSRNVPNSVSRHIPFTVSLTHSIEGREDSNVARASAKFFSTHLAGVRLHSRNLLILEITYQRPAWLTTFIIPTHKGIIMIFNRNPNSVEFLL
jgi:hypothetical protein